MKKLKNQSSKTHLMTAKEFEQFNNEFNHEPGTKIGNELTLAYDKRHLINGNIFLVGKRDYVLSNFVLPNVDNQPIYLDKDWDIKKNNKNLHYYSKEGLLRLFLNAGNNPNSSFSLPVRFILPAEESFFEPAIKSGELTIESMGDFIKKMAENNVYYSLVGSDFFKLKGGKTTILGELQKGCHSVLYYPPTKGKAKEWMEGLCGIKEKQLELMKKNIYVQNYSMPLLIEPIHGNNDNKTS